MEPAGRLSLSVETLHHISQYLSVEDVLNLSATCHYLRGAFNDNSVWKRFTPNTITNLRTAEQHVEPKFQCEDGLTPLCESRVDYSRKTHLLNNWRSTNFVKYSTEVEYNYDTSIFYTQKGKGQVMYNEKYIFLGRFISDDESDGIEVWDISGEPVLHSFLEIENTYYDRIYVIGSNLVVVECKKVNVYQITLPGKTFPLLFSFMITEPNVLRPEEAELQHECDEDCDGWKYFHIDQYLMCNKSGDGGNLFHVWDILSASKSGAFVCPVDGFSVSLISHEGDVWFLLVNQKSVREECFLSFDINKRTFSDTVFKYVGCSNHTIFYKSHIIIFTEAETPIEGRWRDSCCTVYDFKTSREVRKRIFNNAKNNLRLGSTTVVDGIFILLCYDRFQIVDALTLETVEYFQCESDLCFVEHQFNIFGSIFVVACSDQDYLHFWDVKKKRKLKSSLEVHYLSLVYPNESFSKIVAVGDNSMNVLNFW